MATRVDPTDLALPPLACDGQCVGSDKCHSSELNTVAAMPGLPPFQRTAQPSHPNTWNPNLQAGATYPNALEHASPRRQHNWLVLRGGLYTGLASVHCAHPHCQGHLPQH